MEQSQSTAPAGDLHAELLPAAVFAGVHSGVVLKQAQKMLSLLVRKEISEGRTMKRSNVHQAAAAALYPKYVDQLVSRKGIFGTSEFDGV